MKKILTILLLGFTMLFVSCTNQSKSALNIYMPDGAPALAMANVLDEGFSHEDYEANFNIVNANMITNIVSSSSCDLAIIPTTAAAQLYSKGVGIRLASVNVFGNLYIAGTTTLDSLEGLKGKVVYTTIGTTISLVKYILAQNSIEVEDGSEPVADKVVLDSRSDGTEIVQLLKKASTEGKEAYGVLGEPVVSKALGMISNLKLTFDLQKEYKEVTGFDGYPQACLVVKDKVYQEHTGFVEAFLDKLASNENFLKGNVNRLPEIFKKYDSTLQNMTFTLDTITRSNVKFQKASLAMESVKNYVAALVKVELDEEFFL